MEEARIKMVGDASWAKENVITAILRLIREDGALASFSGLPAMLSKQVPYTMGKQVSFDMFAKALYAAAAYFALSSGGGSSNGGGGVDVRTKWAISLGAAFLASIVACLSSQPGDMILTATYKGAGGGHSHGQAAAAAPASAAVKLTGAGAHATKHAHSHAHGGAAKSGASCAVKTSTATVTKDANGKVCKLPVKDTGSSNSNSDSDSRAFSAVVSDIYRKHGVGGFYLGIQARLAHVATIITSQLVIYDLLKIALGLPVTGSH